VVELDRPLQEKLWAGAAVVGGQGCLLAGLYHVLQGGEQQAYDVAVSCREVGAQVLGRLVDGGKDERGELSRRRRVKSFGNGAFG
jgi:hypothetical protein